MWEVEYTNEFGEWWGTLTTGQQEALTDRVVLLGEKGPSLRRPTVGTIKGSRHKNMKELRASADGSSLRVLFAFDPRRQVILLLGATSPATGTPGTGGQSLPPMNSTTCISKSYEMKG